MPERPGSRVRLYGHKSQKPGKKMETRPRSRDEYHTNRWTVMSRKFREENPLCVRCRENGKLVPAEVTDHVVPVEICGNFWDRKNWQALCRKCNIKKGNEDKELIRKYREQR